jgi:hypothetical protein
MLLNGRIEVSLSNRYDENDYNAIFPVPCPQFSFWHFHMAARNDPERSSSICVLRSLIGCMA